MPLVTLPKTQYPNLSGLFERWSRKELSTVLMKNWEVALWMSAVRAMAIVPRAFLSPLVASFSIGGWVGLFYIGTRLRPES
jgi:hypothetical protein